MRRKTTLRAVIILSIIISLWVMSLSASGRKNEENDVHSFKTNKYDFDGDGKKDSAIIEFVQKEEPNYGECFITVNGAKLKIDPGAYGNYIFEPVILKIDKSDNKYQIAICHWEDDFTYTSFVVYDGKELHQVGTIYGILPSIKSAQDAYDFELIGVDGTGVLRATEKSDLLQSWQIKRKYVFLHDELFLVDEDFYDAFAPNIVSVKKGFYVYTEQDDTTETMKLKKGEKITLLGTDNYYWVKIQRENKTIGWIHMVGISKGYSNMMYSSNRRAQILLDPLDYMEGLLFYG